MYILAVYIIPGILLGFLTPTHQHGWFSSILIISVIYSIATMTIELIRGKAKARKWRSYLSESVEAEENSSIVAAALFRASITHHFIYKFHFIAFIVGCLSIAVPLSILSAIIYGLRCWIG